MSDKRQQPSPLTIYIGKDEEERARIDAGLRKLVIWQSKISGNQLLW